MNRKYNQELISKLGKVRDSVLAREYSMSRERIRQLRERGDIPSFTSKVMNNITPLLGIESDESIAEKFNISDLYVKHKRLKLTGVSHRRILTENEKTELISLLGKYPDSELADKFNIHKEYVRTLRLTHTDIRHKKHTKASLPPYKLLVELPVSTPYILDIPATHTDPKLYINVLRAWVCKVQKNHNVHFKTKQIKKDGTPIQVQIVRTA